MHARAGAQGRLLVDRGEGAARPDRVGVHAALAAHVDGVLPGPEIAVFGG